MTGLGRGAVPLLGVLALGTTLSCGAEQAPAERPLEAEEVDPAADAGFVPDTDPRAPARSSGLVGVLPGDFPPDLPLYLPSSLADFGASAAGRRFIDLHTQDSRSQVETELARRLSSQGWRREGDEYAKGDRRVAVQVEGEKGVVTRIRIEY